MRHQDGHRAGGHDHRRHKGDGDDRRRDGIRDDRQGLEVDRRRGRTGRAQRGDVRAAVLRILLDGPAHGYQLMQTMAERTSGGWRPSPGALYPALAQLEREGLVVIEETGGRRLAAITEAGRLLVADGVSLSDPFGDLAAVADDAADLRRALEQLQVAVRTVTTTGDTGQLARAAALLDEARRELYRGLAEQT